MTDRRSRSAIVGGVAAVLLVAGGLATARALTEETSGTAVAPAAESSVPPSLELACASGMSQGGTLDFVGPGSAAEGRARGWPTSPEEAARATFSSQMFLAVRLQGLSLRDGVAVELPSGVAAVQFPATAADGSTQGLITVEEVVDGFWSTTQVASCA